MKTLVIQLARFGDIFQSWPTLKALEDQGELHLLVRESFKDATIGLSDSITVHTMDSKIFLESVLVNQDLDQGLDRLNDFLNRMDFENFDRVVRLFDAQRVQDLQDMRQGYQQLVDSDYQTLRSLQQLASFVSFNNGTIQ